VWQMLVTQQGLFALPELSQILQLTIAQFMKFIQKVFQHILILLLPPSQSEAVTYAMNPRSRTSKIWQW
jgi:hypothetical protein